jgi:CDP-glycerol glycerophosphotransferase (TagB/SpsB family)
MKAQDQKMANQGYIYMAPFWGETQLVQTQKKKLKRKVHDLKNQDAT